MKLVQSPDHAKLVTAYEQAVIEASCFSLAPDADHLLKQRSGRMTWVYVDQSKVLCQPATLRPCLAMISAFLEANFSPSDTVLINADSKFSPHVTGALAAQLGYRQILVNPAATTQAENGLNLRLRLPTRIQPADRFVIVDDTVTSGRTVIEVVNLVKQALSLDMANAEFYLLGCLLRGHETETRAVLAAAGITLHYFTDFASLSQKITDLTPEQRAGIAGETAALR